MSNTNKDFLLSSLETYLLLRDLRKYYEQINSRSDLVEFITDKYEKQGCKLDRCQSQGLNGGISFSFAPAERYTVLDAEDEDTDVDIFKFGSWRDVIGVRRVFLGYVATGMQRR